MQEYPRNPEQSRAISRIQQRVHYPAFMAELSGNASVSALALQFLILTATRTSEMLRAQRNEIDLEAAVWTVPAERMKARRVNIGFPSPLSP